MDIRWVQRFYNYKSALKQLNAGINEFNKRELNLINQFNDFEEIMIKIQNDTD